MAFHVVCVDTGTLLAYETSGIPRVFEEGADAAAVARAEATATGKRHKVQPIVDTSWRDRELGRLRDGTYTALPWKGAGIEAYADPTYYWCWFIQKRKPEALHHYPHVSAKVPGSIAFTDTDEKGSRDIQTTMKPGRYLQRFYDIPECDVTRFANIFIAQYGALQLKFADTPDAIEHVYLNGPNSCMSHPLRDYQSSVHPTRVYGAGDLAIAYLTAGDGDGPEHISARVVCWPSKKIYGRIYGDEDKLSTLLDAQGYSEGSLVGARLLNIEEDGAYVIPYLDGSLSAEDCGKYLRIVNNGDISGDSTSGLSEDNRQCCQHCSGHFSEEDGTYVEEADGFLCDSCYSDNTFYCDYNEVTVYGDEYVTMANGQTWSQDAFDRHGFQCDGNGGNYNNDDAVARPNGERWSREYALDHPNTIEEEETSAEATGVAPLETIKRHIARQGIDHHPAQLDILDAIHDAATRAAQSSYLYPEKETV